jgi:hypothetical protein
MGTYRYCVSLVIDKKARQRALRVLKGVISFPMRIVVVLEKGATG